MTLTGYCSFCDREVELSHFETCPPRDEESIAEYLRQSQARVNALLVAAGRPDLQVDYTAPLKDPTRLDAYYDEVINGNR